MISKCLECGSNDIVPDLTVLTEPTSSEHRPAYVNLVEPEPAKKPFMWMAQEVKSEFYAAVCGACGHTRFHAKEHAELWEAHKKGYTSQA
jgi:predicted nucleic-acid-binding Zn-ribbon protein